MESNINRIAPLIDRLMKPTSQVQLKVSDVGMFMLPEKYFEDEELTEFEYSLHFMDFEIRKGHIVKREPTAQEIWEEEQLVLNKGKKKKKGEPPTPEEQLKLDEFEEIRRLDEERLSRMTETERRYDIAEDIQKFPKIIFKRELSEEEQNLATQQKKMEEQQKNDDSEEKKIVSDLYSDTAYRFNLEGKDLVEFEERVLTESPGIWVYVLRRCTLEANDLVKARKKAKGQSGFAFNPTVFKAFVPLNKLNELMAVETLVRVPLFQQAREDGYQMDLETDCPNYNLEESYLRIKLTVSSTLNPEKTDNHITPALLLPKVQDAIISKSVQILNDLKKALKGEIKILANEFRELFVVGVEDSAAREANTDVKDSVFKYGDDKGKKMIKEAFVENFKKTLGFHDMIERFKQFIPKVISQNLKIKNNLSGVSKTEKDKIFSELYTVLLNTVKKAINEQYQESQDEGFGNTISSQEFTQKKVYRIIKQTTGDDKKERLCLLSKEYETFNLPNLAVNRSKKLIDEGYIDVIPRYCQLLLQNLDYQKAEEYVGKMIQKDEKNIQSLLILLLIYLNQNRLEESRIIIKTLTNIDPDGLVINALNYYLYDKLGSPELSLKFLEIVKRIKQRKLCLIGESKSEKPADLGLGIRPRGLSHAEIDEIWIEVAQEITNLNFPKLGHYFYNLVEDQQSSKGKLLNVQLMLRTGNYVKCYNMLKLITTEYKDDNELLEMFMNVSLKLGKNKVAEQLLLKLLGKRFKIEELLLKLGRLKNSQKKYEDARVIFSKVIESNKKSVLAWIGLGKACSSLNFYNDACEAMKIANILDPLNPDIWLHLVKISLEDKSRSSETIFCFRELLKLNLEEIEETEIVDEIIERMNQNGSYSYSIILLKKISERQAFKTEPDQLQSDSLNYKLGRLYFTMNNFVSAQNYLHMVQASNLSDQKQKEMERMIEIMNDTKEDRLFTLNQYNLIINQQTKSQRRQMKKSNKNRQDRKIKQDKYSSRSSSYEVEDESSSIKLFVGGLPPKLENSTFLFGLTQGDLHEYFSKFGQLKSAKIMLNKDSHKSRGFAFVIFFDPQDAQKILTKTHYLQGKKIDCKLAFSKTKARTKTLQEKSRKIFIGGLSQETNEQDIIEYFQKFGSIESVTIILEPNTLKSRCFGFVVFDQLDSVEEVLKNNKDHYINEKWIECKPALLKEEMKQKKNKEIKETKKSSKKKNFQSNENENSQGTNPIPNETKKSTSSGNISLPGPIGHYSVEYHQPVNLNQNQRLPIYHPSHGNYGQRYTEYPEGISISNSSSNNNSPYNQDRGHQAYNFQPQHSYYQQPKRWVEQQTNQNITPKNSDFNRIPAINYHYGYISPLPANDPYSSSSNMSNAYRTNANFVQTPSQMRRYNYTTKNQALTPTYVYRGNEENPLNYMNDQIGELSPYNYQNYPAYRVENTNFPESPNGSLSSGRSPFEKQIKSSKNSGGHKNFSKFFNDSLLENKDNQHNSIPSNSQYFSKQFVIINKLRKLFEKKRKRGKFGDRKKFSYWELSLFLFIPFQDGLLEFRNREIIFVRGPLPYRTIFEVLSFGNYNL